MPKSMKAKFQNQNSRDELFHRTIAMAQVKTHLNIFNLAILEFLKWLWNGFI
jgi:hypothetical protein